MRDAGLASLSLVFLACIREDGCGLFLGLRRIMSQVFAPLPYRAPAPPTRWAPPRL